MRLIELNFILFYRCASEEAIGRNCREIPGDRRLRYPNCCPRYVCDEDRDSDIIEYGENNL